METDQALFVCLSVAFVYTRRDAAADLCAKVEAGFVSGAFRVVGSTLKRGPEKPACVFLLCVFVGGEGACPTGSCVKGVLRAT